MSSELSAQLRLAIPLVVQQLGFQLMNTVDAALLGRYSDAALGAAGVGNNLLSAITAVGFGIVLGLDTVLPQALGAQDPERARRLLGAGLRLALLLGLGCTLVAVAAPELLTLAGVPDEIAHEARIYVDVRAIGLAPVLMSQAFKSYLAANNITRPLLAAMVLGNIINALLDIVLIYGAGPIPALGVAGAAISTISVQIAILVVYRAGVRKIDGREPRPRSTRADLVEIVRYGLPVGGHLLAEIGIFGAIAVLAAHLGTVASAGHAIVLSLGSFTFSIALGLTIATSVRVGHAIGAGERGVARRRGILGLAIGVAAFGAIAAAFVIVPGPIARVFSDQPQVIAQTIPLLQIAALFTVFDGIQSIAGGGLSGIGDTRATFIGGMIGYYGIGLTLALALAFGAGLGIAGLWWGLTAGVTVIAIYLVYRFFVGTRAGSVDPAPAPQPTG